jgi:hypothetical protein
MLHEWFRFVLESSVQLALTILPAAPLLGKKLRVRVSSALVGADETSAGRR